MLITQNESEAIKMDVRQKRNKVLGERVVKALESRNMDAYYVETKEEAVQKALEWIPEGSTINMGGASSVHECGLIDAIKSGNYNFCDRDKAATPEEKQEIDFRHISKATDTKHYMLLVPTGFLRLPAFGNIIRQTSVIFSMIKEVNCIIIELTVIQKYPERKLRFSYRNSPITISIGGRLKEFA